MEQMMSKEITAEDLVKVGGKEWKTEKFHRFYFNDLPELYGLKCDYYRTGNISSATLDGEHISNTKARSLLNVLTLGKFFFDMDLKKFMGKDLREERVRDLEEIIMNKIMGV